MKLTMSDPEIKEYKVKKRNKKRIGRTKKEIKELAYECFRGAVFTSLQVHDQKDLGMVFMPLMLMSPDQSQGMYQDKPHMYYSYMKDAFPTGVNGYPCFGSVAHLNKEETETFINYYNKIEKVIDEI
tara:strand:+ start:443 stop:823 length:381 start_codon:yes stop_codon:yes gene_type:complete